jgi:CDP-diacylglycerol--glycerol-3-phosphate 3-phosphatidyltransferase
VTENAATAPQPTSRRYFTVPNVLCAIRLLGSPVLIVLAWLGLPGWALAWFIFLSLTDWFDGKLARLLKQETEFGARLDTVADVTFYSCTLLGMVLLRSEVFEREVGWIAATVGSYALSVTAGVIKYRRMPSYHTQLAKVSWLLVFVAILAVFAEWSPWIIRAAMFGVTVTNLEATLITILLPEWRANVRSVFHARRQQSEPEA